MKTMTLLALSVLILTACGGGTASGAANSGQNGTSANPAAFEAPPTPGK